MVRKSRPRSIRKVATPSDVTVRVVLSEAQARHVDKMEDLILEAAASGTVANPRLRKKIQAMARKLKG